MTTNVPSEIVSLSVNDLIPYDSNPKIHSEDQIQQLADSIREWGWTVPILIDENQTVLAGHGRLYAAKKLGMDNVPCVIANNWSEDQKKAYIIADNRLAQNGSWDHKLLNEQLAQLSESFDINLAGFSNTDIEFELPAVLNEEIDPEINSINPTKTTDGYVEFSVVITAEEKTRLIETLNQISKNHGISGHGACLVAMCEMI